MLHIFEVNLRFFVKFPWDMCLPAERVDIVCVPFESRRRKKFCIVSRQKAIAWVPSVPETNC